MKQVIISRRDFNLLRRFALAGIHSEYYSGPPEYFGEAERLKRYVKEIKPLKHLDAKENKKARSGEE